LLTQRKRTKRKGPFSKVFGYGFLQKPNPIAIKSAAASNLLRAQGLFMATLTKKRDIGPIVLMLSIRLIIMHFQRLGRY